MLLHDAFQAGDAASYYSQWKDQRMRLEHYANAEEQGYIAGANMTGFWTPCNMEPHYKVMLGDDLEMEVMLSFSRIEQILFFLFSITTVQRLNICM